METLCEPRESETCDRSEARIYCANCVHCKLVPTPAQGSGRYYLRVRCDAGKWRKKLGEEKIYKYFTVSRRAIESCDRYEDMGDPREFMRDLKKSLPDKDEIYTA
ncbi:MAG TPA: hypothetical protein VLH39_04830 [Magnetospirillaceae bacterium]|nr:hypothetical protein [Magnetospirillaceae bacterium]